MNSDKRIGKKAIPDNLNELLSVYQMISLNKVTSFGWNLIFVRRPLFQEVVPVIKQQNGEQFGVLEEDGRINLEPEITLRKT